MSRTPSLSHLSALTERGLVIRSSDLKKLGLHRQTLERGVDHGFLRRISWGLYVRPEIPLDLEHCIILACRRVPHGIVCLESALRFHGIISTQPDVIWMAIDHKARKPAVAGLNMWFVRCSGQALTQGVVNTRVDGEPIGAYSVAKTVADCLKYRRKLDGAVLAKRSTKPFVKRSARESGYFISHEFAVLKSYSEPQPTVLPELDRPFVRPTCSVVRQATIWHD